MSESLSNTQLKHRLLGAGILVLLAVILIPLFLGEPKYSTEEEQKPERKEFESKIQPLPGATSETETITEAQQQEISQNGGLVLKRLDSTDTSGNTSAAKKNVEIKPLDLSNTDSTKQGGASKSTSSKPASSSQSSKSASTPKPAKKEAPGQTAAVKKQPPAKVDMQAGWVVQTGIFGKPENAKAMANMLKTNGYTPYISDVVGKPGVKRVWIGPFEKKQKAKSVSQKLEQKTGDGGYVKEYPFD